MPKAKEEPAKTSVKVRITKFGAGQVSTGEHVAGEGDIMAQHNDEMTVSPANADALEALGFAEKV